ncbi:MAG: flagellar biosynthesis anti-sigma factor FlgM [Acidobacteriia bacterium]|nr:flagellar biosynthesis anti-sigma factor FlgM [Terriglobia bacterium]
MRINDTTPIQTVTNATSAKAERASGRAREDSAQLSLAARTATDSEKVDRLAAAVAAGTYHVPAHEIAASLIDETIASS